MVALVVVALDGGFFQGTVHVLDLVVSPRIRRFGQPMFHAVFLANTVKTVATGQVLVRLGCELYPIVRQHGMHFIERFVQHALQKRGRDDPFGPRMEFSKRHFTGAVDGHE